jgi:hypothetical protein
MYCPLTNAAMPSRNRLFTQMQAFNTLLHQVNGIKEKQDRSKGRRERIHEGEEETNQTWEK